MQTMQTNHLLLFLSLYSGIIELLQLQLCMHPSASLISVKWYNWEMLVEKLQSQLLTPTHLRMHARVFNEPPQLWHCYVPADLQEGWHYQSLPLRRRFEHAASVQTDSQFTVVFTCPPCLFCLCCPCPHIVWIGLWKEEADGTEQASNLIRLILFFWHQIWAWWLFYIFLFQAVHEHLFILLRRIQNFISIHSCDSGGVFLEINWLTSVTMEAWFSDS